MSQAKFSIGEIIHHKRFNYRGVIFNVDDSMQLSEQWYEQVAVNKITTTMLVLVYGW